MQRGDLHSTSAMASWFCHQIKTTKKALLPRSSKGKERKISFLYILIPWWNEMSKDTIWE